VSNPITVLAAASSQGFANERLDQDGIVRTGNYFTQWCFCLFAAQLARCVAAATLPERIDGTMPGLTGRFQSLSLH